jgi:hypothetical protein
MSKRRQDGNLRDVTESDNCVPICKLFMAQNRATNVYCASAGWQCRTLCTHRGANEKGALYWRRRSAKKLTKSKIQRSGYVIVCPFIGK